MEAPPHPRQAERLAALHAYGVLDTPPEAAFDDVARLAATLCGTPIAVVNLIDEARQWFKSEVGLGVRELPLRDSICAHAILEHEFVEIPDTLADDRLCDNPLCLSEPGLRFYAGALLSTDAGLPLGTLCVLDQRPRVLDATQREALRVLARQVMAQLELRRALAAQRRLSDELSQANRNKDDFLATLGHELRNPLQPVRLALAALNRPGLDAEAARSARDVIGRQIGQMERLVDDLLDTARIGQGKLELSRARVAVDALLARAVETSLPQIEAAGHALSTRLPAEPVEIDGDAPRLVQAVCNLLNNAARYTPRGGRIALSADADDATVRIRVADTGVGLAPGDLERIFEPFVQGEPGDDGERVGLGIGLALVRRLVELHGGSVRAESGGRGLGSTFEMRLPRAGAA